MAAPYLADGRGYLADMVRWVRMWSDEPAVRDKYDASAIVQMIQHALDLVLEDVYCVTHGAPMVRFDILINGTVAEYPLPANLKELWRVGQVGTSGGFQWDVRRSAYYSWGCTQVRLIGNRMLRFDPLPETLHGTTLTLEYLPGGPCFLHQNAAPVWSTANDTVLQIATTTRLPLAPVSTTWLLGHYDRRAQAYLGSWLRVFGTVNDVAPTGWTYFPVQERVVRSYTELGASVTFDALGFDPVLLIDKTILLPTVDSTTGRTYVLYEVLPNVDPGVMWLAATEAARQLSAMEGNWERYKVLTGELSIRKRSLLNRWANTDQGQVSRIETERADQFDNLEMV